MLRSNRQTDKQTDGLENPTHADRYSRMGKKKQRSRDVVSVSNISVSSRFTQCLGLVSVLRQNVSRDVNVGLVAFKSRLQTVGFSCSLTYFGQ